MADQPQEAQKEVLAGMASTQLNQRQVQQLMDTIQVLSSAMSNMLGTYMTASDHWRANVTTGEIEYDLGLAAALDREAQIGVSGHEIAHLRFSKPVKFTRKSWAARDAEWAFHVVNILEDRRVEQLMVADFPGLAANIDRLRAAFDKPLVVRAMGMAEPHVQFLGGLYATAFDREFTATNPQAIEAIAKHRVEISELVNARTTTQIARAVEREGGIADTLFRLRDLPVEEAVKRDPEAVQQQPQQPLDEPGKPGEQGGTPAPAEGQPDGPVDGSPSGTSNEGEKSEQGQPGGAKEPGGWPGAPDEGGEGPPAPGGEGGEPGPSGAGEGEGAAGDGEAGGESAGAPGAGGGSQPGSWGPSQDDLAALPDGMGDLLSQIAASAEAMAELSEGKGPGGQELKHVRSDAEQLAKSLSGMRDMVGSVRRSVDATMHVMHSGVDDDTMQLAKNDEAYDAILYAVRAEAEVLSRRLSQVLAENRSDRLASVQYRSGTRLSMPGLLRAASDPNYDSVYRRKGRSRNRQYAIGILGDVSGSMRGDKLSQMAYTAILASHAIENAGGCKVGVYAFARECAVLKPFEIGLDIRGGYLGSFGTGSRISGGSTMIGAAIERVGGDMLAQFDDSWRRVIMVITDGIPSDSAVAERNIRSLVRHDDFDFFGIGIDIRDPGRMGQMFPHWVALADAWALGPALMRLMRKAIVLG